MRTVLLICSIPFILRIFLYFVRLIRVRRFLEEEVAALKRIDVKTLPRKKILLLVPVLREQNVIVDTIEHFCGMELVSVDLMVMIVGTCREARACGDTTLDVVERWLGSMSNRMPENVRIDYCEANDEKGDRASQLNWAVKHANEIGWNDWEVVGVYDADSLPSRDSLSNVVKAFCSIKNLDACQQPARFIRAANAMARNEENPLLVANALYQSTWTMISELPMWIGHYSASRKARKSFRHLYFIGHGEFLSRNAYETFMFPEGEVTDGIQIGYRMGFSGSVIIPLPVFCEDDVPHQVRALVKQHKRWFGGCMNFFSAYKATGRNARWYCSAVQMIDGFWSQARWAWAALFYIVLVGISLCEDLLMAGVLCSLLIIYGYILPILAHRLMNADINVRIIDWLCVPCAILIKALGPNLYICDRIFKKNIQYEKVER